MRACWVSYNRSILEMLVSGVESLDASDENAETHVEAGRRCDRLSHAYIINHSRHGTKKAGPHSYRSFGSVLGFAAGASVGRHRALK